MASILDLLYGADTSSGGTPFDAFERQIAGRDYLGLAGRQLNNTKFDNTWMTPNQSLAMTAGQSFLSSVLGELGANDQERQIAAVTKLLPDLYDHPSTVVAPENVDTRAFEGLRASAIGKKALDDQALKKTLLTSFGADYDLATGNITPNTQLAEAVKAFSRAKESGQPDPDVQKELLKEAGTKQDLAKSFAFIDDQFEQAKLIPRDEAALGKVTEYLGVPTPALSKFKGISDATLFQADKIIGREINDKARERMLSLSPQWYDTNERIDEKKKLFKEFISSLAKSTPLTKALGGDEPAPVKDYSSTSSDTPLIKLGKDGKRYQRFPQGWKAID